LNYPDGEVRNTHCRAVQKLNPFSVATSNDTYAKALMGKKWKNQVVYSNTGGDMDN